MTQDEIANEAKKKSHEEVDRLFEEWKKQREADPEVYASVTIDDYCVWIAEGMFQ